MGAWPEKTGSCRHDPLPTGGGGGRVHCIVRSYVQKKKKKKSGKESGGEASRRGTR